MEIRNTNFNLINRCYLIKDEQECLYLVAVRYYIDEILYFHVLSLRDQHETRFYKVEVEDGIVMNSSTGGAYIPVPVKILLTSKSLIRVFFKFS